MKKSSPALAFCALAAALGLGAAPASAGGWQQPPGQVPEAGEVRTVAEGLTTPLSLAVGRGGDTYVAQSFAGLLTRISPDGAAETLATGPAGYLTASVSHRRGTTYYTESTGADTGSPVTNISTLKSINREGTVETLANISEFEYTENPDSVNTYGFDDLDAACAAQLEFPATYPGRPDSNPFASLPSGRGKVLVADAGMNAVVEVDLEDGSISTVAVLPPRPLTLTAEIVAEAGFPACAIGAVYNLEPVPTDLAWGPDGALYVTSLPGGPEGTGPNLGSVFAVDVNTGGTELAATGFNGATGLAVNDNGDIFVAELFGNRISVVPAGTRTPQLFLAVNQPSALDLRGSTLYATTDVLPPGGVPEPGAEPVEPPAAPAPPAGKIISIGLDAQCGSQGEDRD